MIEALRALAREQAALRQVGDERSVRAKRIDDAIERVTVERHGLALIAGGIEAEVLSALHDDAGAKALAAEQRGLARKAGREPISYEDARTWARHTIGKEPTGATVDVGLLAQAEARAALASLEARAKGDFATAVLRKQEQMMAHALWRETHDARQRAEAAQRRTDRRAAAPMSDASLDDHAPALIEGIGLGDSARNPESGPGEWRPAKRGMKARAMAYQFQITGRKNEDYIVGGVKSDGFSDGTLLEVKGPGYAQFLTGGEFRETLRVRRKLLRQMELQPRVSNGIPITWYIAELDAFEAISTILKLEKIKGIRLFHTNVRRAEK